MSSRPAVYTGLLVALLSVALTSCQPGFRQAEAATAPRAEVAESEAATGGDPMEVAQAARAAGRVAHIQPDGPSLGEMLAQVPWSTDPALVAVLDVSGLLQLAGGFVEGSPLADVELRTLLSSAIVSVGPGWLGTELPVDLADATDIAVLWWEDGDPSIVAWSDTWQGQEANGWDDIRAFTLSGGWLRVGDPEFASAPADDGSEPPAVLGSLPADALVAVYGGADFAPEWDVTAATGAVEASGRMVARLVTDDADSLQQGLADVRAAVPAVLDGMRVDMPPARAAWLDYAELMHRAAWSRVALTTDDAGLSFELPAPSCGDLRQQLIGLVVLFAGADLPGSDAPSEWSAWDVPLAPGCNPLRGSPANLPADAARVASASVSEGFGRALWVIDAAWLTRNILPDGAGLLPFSVEPDAIADVFGGRPGGLADWLDAEADAVFYTETRAANPGAETNDLATLPDGLAELLPLEAIEQRDDIVVVRWHSGSTTFASRSLASNLEQAAPDTDLSRAMDVAELDAPFALILDRAIMSALSDISQHDMPGGISDMLASAESLVVTWTDRGLTYRFTVAGDRDDVLLAADAHLQVLLDQGRTALELMLEPVGVAGSALLSGMLDEIALHAEGEHQIDLVLVRSPASMMVMGASVVAVSVPTFRTYIKRSKTSEATMNIRRVFDLSVTHHAMQPDPSTASFPPSAGPTPTIVPGVSPCDTESVPDPAAWEHPTWQTLGFEITDPHYYVYQYDSSGVGEGAQFTASAFGDLDCDGLMSTFVRFGIVEQGEVRGSAGLYIHHELE